jgi:pyruvate/2-oxoglutarate dehydrogenase complex dihydrolipoamide dehydrogenase (E3) component
LRPFYDLVVIGGGTAGLVSAAGAAGLGARVALVERARLGGDCLWTGCVPSKALLHAARAGKDFAAAMAHVRASRDRIAPHDSAERLTSLGVEVIIGTAAFADARTIDVGGRALRFRKAVIATGSRPAIPAIEALDSIPFHTNETIFEIAHQPRTLTVLGGGPSGCELAQAFARLGTRVTVVESGPQILPREDPDASAVIASALAADGVDVKTGASVRSARELTDDATLVVVGRRANVETLGLERAGIAWDDAGVRVDAVMRTTNPRVYAAGDVASRFKFTHAADAMARLVIQNALFFGRKRSDALAIPWCTFTSPEIASVGVNSSAAAAQGGRTVTVPLADVDRAVVDAISGGFVRIHHDRDRILGATIVAPAAGEVIGTIAYVMQAGGTLSSLSQTVFPYPTLSVALRQAADAYRRTRLTPGVRKALKYYFGQWSPRS